MPIQRGQFWSRQKVCSWRTRDWSPSPWTVTTGQQRCLNSNAVPWFDKQPADIHTESQGSGHSPYHYAYNEQPYDDGLTLQQPQNNHDNQGVTEPQSFSQPTKSLTSSHEPVQPQIKPPSLVSQPATSSEPKLGALKRQIASAEFDLFPVDVVDGAKSPDSIASSGQFVKAVKT